MAGVDQLNQVYFDGVADGQLRIQQCKDCAAYQFYPRVICKHCSSEHLSLTAASGRGQVASFTVVRRGVSAAFEATYVIALIDLEEGVRLAQDTTHYYADTNLRKEFYQKPIS